MAEPLKDQYLTETSLDEFADTLVECHPVFDKERFLELVFDSSWKEKELMKRMRHVTECLHKTLPESYNNALDILIEAAPDVKGMEAICLPDYVELYGQDNFELSLPALEHFTKYSTAEFAVRPFIAREPDRVMTFMNSLD